MSTNNNSISVIMAVYQSEKQAYLDRSLQSVWADQILKPDEIILIIDGPISDDLHNTVSKWKSIIGNRMIIIKNQENLGLTQSLIKGIKVATGEYIARMDSDDISLPERFQVQLSYMQAHPEVAVLGGSIQEIDEYGKWGKKRTYPSTQEEIRKYIAMANPLAHPTVLIRKSIFDNGFSYDPRFSKSQDLKLWFDLLDAGMQIRNLPDVVLYFRRTTDTYRRRSSRLYLTSEYRIYTQGIKKIHGPFNWRLIFPVARYVVKSMPHGFISFVYDRLFRKHNNRARKPVN